MTNAEQRIIKVLLIAKTKFKFQEGGGADL